MGRARSLGAGSVRQGGGRLQPCELHEASIEGRCRLVQRRQLGRNVAFEVALAGRALETLERLSIGAYAAPLGDGAILDFDVILKTVGMVSEAHRLHRTRVVVREDLGAFGRRLYFRAMP